MPSNEAEEIEQGLRLMKAFRKIKSATAREQIIAFVSECETQTMVISPTLANANNLMMQSTTKVTGD